MKETKKKGKERKEGKGKEKENVRMERKRGKVNKASRVYPH